VIEYIDNMEWYLSDIDKKGLSRVWDSILNDAVSNPSEYVDITDRFGLLYEIGLAHVDKNAKKSAGKYFTPDDVALIMSQWLEDLPGDNICDVGCGVGNLILAYLKYVGEERALNLIKDGHIWLYDNDPVAIKICKFTIAIKYGVQYLDSINCVKGDFLNKKVNLPESARVISNPPYGKTGLLKSWNVTENIDCSRELYAAFAEKIFEQSVSSVLITPYSFIGGNKFYSLRKVMNKLKGFIVCFDNVPGNIFNGRKQGIFNSNMTNSVRAAITVSTLPDDKSECGYVVSPMIRFKTSERSELLDCDVLKGFLGNNRQTVNDVDTSFVKCFKELESVYYSWKSLSDKILSDYVDALSENVVYMPNTCRYFSVGAKRKLQRSGMHEICVSEEFYNIIYCWINSSFVYWHWRLFDGGINYPQSLLLSMPVFFDKLTEQHISELDRIASEMQRSEVKYLSYKMNAKAAQETVKFPVIYRNQIDDVFLDALGSHFSHEIFDRVHANHIFSDDSDGYNSNVEAEVV